MAASSSNYNENNENESYEDYNKPFVYDSFFGSTFKTNVHSNVYEEELKFKNPDITEGLDPDIKEYLKSIKNTKADIKFRMIEKDLSSKYGISEYRFIPSNVKSDLDLVAGCFIMECDKIYYNLPKIVTLKVKVDKIYYTVFAHKEKKDKLNFASLKEWINTAVNKYNTLKMNSVEFIVITHKEPEVGKGIREIFSNITNNTTNNITNNTTNTATYFNTDVIDKVIFNENVVYNPKVKQYCGEMCLLYAINNSTNSNINVKDFANKIGTNGKMTFLDFVKFTELYPQYCVSIYNYYGSKLININNQEGNTVINLLYYKQHYCFIKNTKYRPRKNKCQTIGLNRTCITCKYNYCIKYDLNFKFDNLTKSDRINNNHLCNHYFCYNCQELRKRYHRCYISPISINKTINTNTATNINTKPIDYYVYDIESFLNNDSTDDSTVINHSIAIIIIQHLTTGDKHIFEDVKDFITFVQNLKNKSYLYAHNSKAYDNILLMYQFQNRNILPGQIIKNGQKILCLRFKNVMFMDSYSHINMSLRNAAAILPNNSIEKVSKGFFPYTFYTSDNKNYIGPIPDKKHFGNFSTDNSNIEFEEFYNNYIDNNLTYDIRAEAIKYCSQDVNLLRLILLEYQKNLLNITNIDPLQSITISSYALKVFRTHYLTDNTIGILNNEEHKFVKRGFQGGRTEALFLHKKWTDEEYNSGIYGEYIDVNSLYPYVSLKYKLPIGHPKIIQPDTNLQENIQEYIDIINNDNFFSVVECDIKCPTDLFIPVLLTRIDNKLMGTLIDKKQMVFNSPELKLALTKGYKITKIYKMHIYNTSTDIFKKYVKTFIKIKESARLEGNECRVKISKLLLNSLWGKFCQRVDLPTVKFINTTEEWNNLLAKSISGKIVLKDFNLVNSNNNESNSSMFVKYEKIVETNEQMKRNTTNNTTNIALASSITSYARVKLYKTLDKLKERVLYYDTDSIVYEKNNDGINIKCSPELGKWKLEATKIKEFISIGPKSYIIKLFDDNHITKCKGFVNNAITSKTYLDLIYGNTEFETIYNNQIKIHKNQIISEMTKKILSFHFDKRIISEKINCEDKVQTIPKGFIIPKTILKN